MSLRGGAYFDLTVSESGAQTLIVLLALRHYEGWAWYRSS